MSEQNKKFVIGQVVFIFFGEEYKLVPVQISEENIIRSMQGERTTYKVLVNDTKVMTLEELLVKTENRLFESSEEARSTLLNAARATIDRIVASATIASRQRYPNQILNRESPQSVTTPVKTIPFDQSDIMPNEEATPLVKQPARRTEYDGPVVEHEDGTISRIKFGTGS